MHCRISPRRMCNPSGFIMLFSSSYHRLLINEVKRNSKIDGMGLFKMPPIPFRPELTAPDPVTVEKRQPRKVVMFPSAEDDSPACCTWIIRRLSISSSINVAPGQADSSFPSKKGLQTLLGYR